MSTFKLEQVGTYVRTGRAAASLLFLLKKVRQIFTFPQERANRYKRFVQVVRAYKAGTPVVEIEREFGCCKSTILRYARLTGLPVRPRGFEPDIRRATIALYRGGKSIAEIQARLGVSQAYVSKTATEEGINRRNFKKRAKETCST